MRVEDRRPAVVEERESALAFVLHRLWTYSLTTKSDEARRYADEIAEASGRGFITTAVIPSGKIFGRLWKLTPSGLQFLFDNSKQLNQEEEEYVKTYSAD